MSLGHHWYPVLGGPATATWIYEPTISTAVQNAAGLTITTGTLTPNAGDLMIATCSVRTVTVAPTQPTLTDTGSGGWSPVNRFIINSLNGLQVFWKIATATDAGGITVTLTGNGSGSPVATLIVDTFRHNPVMGIGLDLSATLVGTASVTTLTLMPASPPFVAIAQSGNTDEMAYTALQAMSATAISGTNTMAGTSAAKNLLAGVNGSAFAFHLATQYALTVQSSATVSNDKFINTWTTADTDHVMFGASWWPGTAFVSTQACNLPLNTNTTTITTPASLTYGSHDLLIGAAFSFGPPRYNTYTWSNGASNNNLGASAAGSPSVSLNYAQPSTAGTTTFNFTTTVSQFLQSLAIQLTAANPGVSPTLRATSNAAGTAAGSGALSLGSYTTVSGDCIVLQLANTATAVSGAGATWQVISECNEYGQVWIGRQASAGFTSVTVTFSSGGSPYVVAVFGGVV